LCRYYPPHQSAADAAPRILDHVNDDRAYGAMPKLYGAPAYARPHNAGVETASKPFDPDDLPIEAERTDLDQELVDELSASSYAPAATDSQPSSADTGSRATGSSSGFPLRLPGRKG
jgi:hypothetical protein